MIGLLSVSTGIGGISSDALLAAPPCMKLGRIMPLGDSITNAKGQPVIYVSMAALDVVPEFDIFQRHYL